jgi:large subunit ribosomal protein L1
MAKTKTVDMTQTDSTSPDISVEKKEKKVATGPRVRGKAYQAKRALVNRDRLYSLSEAVSLVKQTSFSKFDGSVELHMTIKKESLSVNVDLPHATGKTKKIEIADEETIKKLATGKVDFDVLLATADMMPKLVPFARILGPKGLMPNPKKGTLIRDPKQAANFSASTLTVKTEKKAPVIHTVAGKVSQEEKQIEENVNAIFEAVNRRQIIKAYIKPTMGPSVKVHI